MISCDDIWDSSQRNTTTNVLSVAQSILEGTIAYGFGENLTKKEGVTTVDPPIALMLVSVV